MASLLEQAGAQPQKQPRYAPIFMDRSFTGIYTQRAVVHDPADITTAKYYGGRPDALWAGANIELTNRLTLARRPGLTTFNNANEGSNGFIYPTTPLTSYTFHAINGTLFVMVDTGTTGPSEIDTVTGVTEESAGFATYTGTFTSGADNGLVGYYVTIAGMSASGNNGIFPVYESTATTITVLNLDATLQTLQSGTATTLYATSVDTSSGGTAVYHGVFTNGAGNAFVGLSFTVTGFSIGVNNGTFVCTASTETTLTLANAFAVAETAASTTTVISAGAIYWDQQNGSAQLIYAKSTGAGQTHFIGSGGILFFGDGVDVKKWTPYNVNPLSGTIVNGVNISSVWNWGIATPPNQPSYNIVSSGSANTQWQPNTVFSTMGITWDSATNQLWQLIGVNAAPTLAPNVANAQFGTSGAGGPAWNNSVNGTETAYGTTLDNTGGGNVTWKNISWIQQWAVNAVYGDAGTAGTASNCVIYDPITNSLYANFNGNSGLSRSGSVEPKWNKSWVYGPGGFTEGSADGAGGTHNGVLYSQPHWFFVCTYSGAPTWKPGASIPAWYHANGGSNLLTAAVVEPYITPFPTTAVPPATTPTAIFFQINNGSAGTSGSNYTPFPATASLTAEGQPIPDNQLLWQLVSSPSDTNSAFTATWKPNYPYVPWTIAGGFFGCVYDSATQTIQVCVSDSGGSGESGPYAPGSVMHTSTSMTVAANTPVAGQATVTLGSGNWAVNPVVGLPVEFTGFAASSGANNGAFQVVSFTTNSVVISNASAVNETHNAVATYNPWGTGYGTPTSDGGLVWYCVGTSYAWTPNTIWNLPLTGFSPPQPTQTYGGSTIDANGLVQTVIQTGLSGSTAPSWGSIGTDTTDGSSSPQLVWYAESYASTNSLMFSKGYSYAYSYKARPLDDIYSAPPLGGIDGVQQIPPGYTGGAFSAPFGSETNAVSSASPAVTFTGTNTGAVIYVSGQYSNDPQVDTIIIWRSTDGGGPDQMYELTEIPNVVGNGTWTFADYLPDAPTTVNGVLYPGLNTEIPAPINGVNDPPDATTLPQVYNFERIWAADGQYVSFSGGPDTFVGNPDEAFSVSDSLPFQATVTRVVKATQGLVTFLTDSIQVIVGGPATTSFSQVEFASGIGLLDYNYLDTYAGEIYFFSSANMFMTMTPSLNVINAGFAIGDQFANLPSSGTPASGIEEQVWNPDGGYVAVHQATIDNAIYVADGEFGWYRLNPRQAGVIQGGVENVWSPFGVITNGCHMVMSIETTPGVKQLLVGPRFGNNQILARDISVFTDNGIQYDAYFEMGNLTLAHPGELAIMKFIEMDFAGVGFQPTVSYLLNEIEGTFEPFTANPIFDPPQLYGATLSPTSYSPNRYYFASNAFLARCRHMRVKVDYGRTSASNDMFNMTIYGRRVIEG